MAVRPVVICDMPGCDGDGPATHFRITYPDGASWEVDLCTTGANHAEILTQFREEGWGAAVKRGGRRRIFQVTSLDEIQGKGRKRS